MAKRTWVYLMKDSRNGFYKIGESIKPAYRERTLQAEMPLIDLMTAWRGTCEDERFLHRKFARKRLRGEWFDINWDDIEEILKYFYEAEIWQIGKSQAQIDQEERDAERLVQGEAYLVEDLGYEAAILDFAVEGFGDVY